MSDPTSELETTPIFQNSRFLNLGPAPDSAPDSKKDYKVKYAFYIDGYQKILFVGLFPNIDYNLVPNMGASDPTSGLETTPIFQNSRFLNLGPSINLSLIHI